jgi:tripartite-type tricarboxylate transporter receptor subunit TctC
VWALALAAVQLGAATEADADACRDALAGKRMRWIVSTGPGGTSDVYARLIGPHLAERLGAETVVENHRGGSGLVAMEALLESPTDGTTVGIVGGPQTLVGAIEGRLPDPVGELPLLGQLGPSRYVWAHGRDAEIDSLEKLFEVAERRPILIATYQPKGSTFLRLVTLTDMLGLNREFVTGYRSSAQLGMAAVRNEVDLISIGVQSHSELFANGDLEAVASLYGMEEPGFEDLPTLLGPEGIVARRTRELGRDVDEVAAAMKGIEALVRVGRLIVTPPGTPPERVACLRDHLAAAMASDGLLADLEAADRRLEFLGPAATTELLVAARDPIQRFRPAVETARTELSR